MPYDFEKIVERAINSLPQEFKDKLDNVDVVVEDFPANVQLKKAGLRNINELLGLYEGVPLNKRNTNYGMVLPDKISIFRKPIETRCHSESEIEKAVYNVLCHEIAHHFGFTENQLRIMQR